MSWDDYELPPLQSWGTFPRARSSGSLPSADGTDRSEEEDAADDRGGGGGAVASAESLAQRTLRTTTPADLRVCHDNMRRLMFDVESQASPSTTGVTRFEPDQWFAKQRQEQQKRDATDVDELIEGLSRPPPTSSLKGVRIEPDPQPTAPPPPPPPLASLKSVRIEPDPQPTAPPPPPLASLKSVRIEPADEPTEPVTYRDDSTTYDDEPPTGPPMRTLISLRSVPESAGGGPEQSPQNASSAGNAAGFRRSTTAMSLPQAKEEGGSSSSSPSNSVRSLKLDTPVDWASLWAWGDQATGDPQQQSSDAQGIQSGAEHAITVLDLTTPSSAWRRFTPSSRKLWVRSDEGTTMGTGIRPWFNLVSNLWPVLWLPLESLVHYVTITGALWAIWAMEEWQQSTLLSLFIENHTLPSEKVLVVMALWMVMAGHAIRRVHNTLKCYQRIKPFLKSKKTAYLLAHREGTWVALEAADRTEALRMIRTDPGRAEVVAEVGCCFRYWCLSCWCCCFHKRFLEPIFSHSTSVMRVTHAEKQAYVTMWELVAGIWSRFPHTGFYQGLMQLISFLGVLASPFLGAPTYHWPETLWLWKMMFWRASVDVVFFFVFVRSDCYGYLFNEVGARRLSSAAANMTWPSATLAPSLREDRVVGRQLSASGYGSCHGEEAWMWDELIFTSHGGQAVVTNRGNCQIGVSLQLDPTFEHGELHQSVIDNNNGNYSVYGWGNVTNSTLQADLGVPWKGAVLENRDFIVYGKSVDDFTAFSHTMEAEGCADLTGAWYNKDEAWANGENGGDYLDRLFIYNQDGCNVEILNPKEPGLQQYDMAITGQTFSFQHSRSYLHGHLWHNNTFLLYNSAFEWIAQYERMEALDCQICAQADKYFYPNIVLTDFYGYTCGTAQTIVNLGMGGSCDFWENQGQMTWEALETTCCRSNSPCATTPWLSVRLFLGVATLITLVFKWRYYRRFWNPALGGTITNYWGRKDFWEKWVGSVEPVPFDLFTPIDLWAEYGRLERRSMVRQEIHGGVDFLPQSLAEVDVQAL